MGRDAMTGIDKGQLDAAVLARLQAELDALEATAAFTRDSAVHDEARAENDKDTRGLEQTYLARGQAQRVIEMRATVTQIRTMELLSFGPEDAIAASALVRVRVDDLPRLVYLTVAGGGHKVELEGETVQLVTTRSPLGRGLLGKQVDDAFELKIGGAVHEYEVEAVG